MIEIIGHLFICLTIILAVSFLEYAITNLSESNDDTILKQAALYYIIRGADWALIIGFTIIAAYRSLQAFWKAQ